MCSLQHWWYTLLFKQGQVDITVRMGAAFIRRSRLLHERGWITSGSGKLLWEHQLSKHTHFMGFGNNWKGFRFYRVSLQGVSYYSLLSARLSLFVCLFYLILLFFCNIAIRCSFMAILHLISISVSLLYLCYHNFDQSLSMRLSFTVI